MSSTEFNIGLSGEGKNSSRVLKPPGGGHHDIFGEPEKNLNKPRPKYDQQNSSNLNQCMNTPDPNLIVEQVTQLNDGSNENEHKDVRSRSQNNITGPPPEQAPPAKGRVPPGGFSSGLW